MSIEQPKTPTKQVLALAAATVAVGAVVISQKPELPVPEPKDPTIGRQFGDLEELRRYDAQRIRELEAQPLTEVTKLQLAEHRRRLKQMTTTDVLAKPFP
jgi:hypothetical protein